ncbi:MAG TPA: TIGR03668 family PPOX class F420-dependent oxidoreductase [Candidatus Dormibacteraeota bacterium]|jgi:PPOX class probable F420-dependent enzyme|nr:TIGR03668 family PPOX class F420-dependent oxidoreductase [Candidatus Dormibacteraeota bacterium]
MRLEVERARVGRLCTIRPGGTPHVVPFCFSLEEEHLYWAVDAKPKREGRLQRLRNLDQDPRAVVLVDRWSEDWSELWWVRLEGRARTVEAAAERSHALGLLSAKYPQYRAQPPPGPVIRIDVERWSGWAGA